MTKAARLSAPALAIAVALAPAVASAHTGIGQTAGFFHGFWHPIGGIDHVLAMVAVGLFAAQLDGRALWAVPATFVAVMAAGGALGMAGMALPAVEVGIALSVVVLGLVVLASRRWPLGLAMALVGVFALFHGHAHGAEMPVDASGLAYGLGFVLATALMHLAGIGLGIGLARLAAGPGGRLTRAGGAAISLAGLALLVGALS
jgi:urease accessory protein